MEDRKYTNEEVINKIHENYNSINEKMIAELNLTNCHDVLCGSFREKIWLEFFKNIIPKKFSLAQGVIIIDSNGERSNEVDIAVFDEQYTPYVLQYGSLKFIPIEAVVCVVECKSHSVKSESLIKWADSIDKLKSNPTGLARVIQGLAIGLTNNTQQQTRPIKIQVSLYSTKEETDTLEEKLKNSFDIVIRPKKFKNKKSKIVVEKFSMKIFNEDKTLGWWTRKLNSSKMEANEIGIYHLKEKELEKYDFKKRVEERKVYIENPLSDLKIENNEILSLTFQLNQLLMLINNPMMFPHFAYAKTFNKIIKEMEEENKTKN